MMPVAPLSPLDAERFWSRVRYVDGCLEWQGTSRAGYGSFRGRPAHRVAWEAERGPIPAGFVIDHLCRNPPCVNPLHLEPVTVGENVARGRSGTPRAYSAGDRVGSLTVIGSLRNRGGVACYLLQCACGRRRAMIAGELFAYRTRRLSLCACARDTRMSQLAEGARSVAARTMRKLWVLSGSLYDMTAPAVTAEQHLVRSAIRAAEVAAADDPHGFDVEEYVLGRPSDSRVNFDRLAAIANDGRDDWREAA